jgi:hypothetical protein
VSGAGYDHLFFWWADADEGDEQMADTERVVFEDCFCKHATSKALLVLLPDGDEQWIPKSQLDDDSEIYDDGEHARGTLMVSRWFADKEGFTDQGTIDYVGG